MNDIYTSTMRPQQLPSDESLGELEAVVHFDGAMPTGVTVSRKGRIFVNFPKWGDDVRFTVAEIRDGRPVAYPDEKANRSDPNDPAAALMSVQSVVVDPADRLWILDTGSPLFEPTRYGGPKLICVNLVTDRIENTILFREEVVLPTSYLNDVRFDLARRRGHRLHHRLIEQRSKRNRGRRSRDRRKLATVDRPSDHQGRKPAKLSADSRGTPDRQAQSKRRG